MLRYLPLLVVLAVWIYAFIDCLNTPEEEIRKLPKVMWIIIILLFGQVLLGPVAWFWVGRPRKNTPYGATRANERRWVAPDDNPDFLKSLNDNSQRGPQPPADRKDGGDGPVSGAPGDTPEGERPAASADESGKRPDLGKRSDSEGEPEGTSQSKPESKPRPGSEPEAEPGSESFLTDREGDEALFKEWEADLQRREGGGGKDSDGGPEDSPPRS